jgi:hypothetical protein
VKTNNNGTVSGNQFCSYYGDRKYNRCTWVKDIPTGQYFGCTDIYKPGTEEKTNWSVGCRTYQ